MLADHTPDTAPNDGRVIRGWFRWPGGAGFIAVSWSKALQRWVDLKGDPVPEGYVLAAWGEG